MKNIRRILGISLVALVVVATVVVLLTRTGHSPDRSAATIAPSMRATQSTAPSKSPKTPTQKPSDPDPSFKPDPKLISTETQLIRELNQFVQGYYLLQPQDTPTAIRARVAPFVSKNLLGQMDFSIQETTAEHQERVKQKLLQQGIPLTGTLELKPARGSKTDMQITLQVEVFLTQSDGTELNAVQMSTMSEWRQQPDKSWQAVSFTERGSQ